MSVLMTRLKMTKDVNRHRSAPAPVGMVAAVSMKTSWKRKSAATPGVITLGLRKKPFKPKRAELLAGDVNDGLRAERRVVAERTERADAAHLEGEAERPESDDADCVDEEVHGHRVRDVLGAREARLDERETRLHEHHEKAGEGASRRCSMPSADQRSAWRDRRSLHPAS